MVKKHRPLGRIRLVYRRSSPLTKIAVATVIVLSMAALFSLNAARRAAEKRCAELQSETARIIAENDALRSDLALLGTPESTEKIAREKLGLVKPGTVFFRIGK